MTDSGRTLVEIQAERAKLEATLAGLRDAITQGRQLQKDLKAEYQVIRGDINGRIKDLLEGAVEKSLAELAGTVNGWMRRSVAKIIAEFDKLEALVLHKDAKSRKAGEPTLEDLIRTRFASIEDTE